MKKKMRRVFLIIFVELLLACWCQVWISYHLLTVKEYDLTDGAFSGTKETGLENAGAKEEDIHLVVLADLHDGNFGKCNDELVEKVAAQQPDLILLDGDLLNEDSKSHEPVLRLIRDLKVACQCPIFYGMGNHEKVYVESHADFWEDVTQAGAVYLEQQYADLEINGKMIRVGGLYEYAFALDDFNSVDLEKMDPDVVAFLQEFQATDAYKVLMAHRPDSFIFAQEKDAWQVDLLVSGHVHGGQLVIPVLGGLWAPDQGFFPTYVHGKYDLGNNTMLITSGLGSHRELLPRFANPPEILSVKFSANEDD